MAWSSRMIEALADLKRAGIADFPVAWSMAMRANPPAAREIGYRETLFPDEQDAEDELSEVEWVQRAAQDAWTGARPILRHLRAAMELVTVDDSAPARNRHSAGSRAA